jgi:Flp pilus assembly protein TadD
VSHPEGSTADPVFERIGLEFLADFLARAARHRPDDVEVLAELASTLTRLGRYQEGLGLDRRLVELLPEDATVRYNLACSLALCQASAAALLELERAVELGYADAEHLLADEDLRSLRSEPNFVALVERLRAQP